MTPKNSPQPKKRKRKKKKKKTGKNRSCAAILSTGGQALSTTARRRERQPETESQRERGSEASLARTRLLESSDIVLRKFLGRCLLANPDHFLIAAEFRGEKKNKQKRKTIQAKKKKISQHRKKTRKKEKIVYRSIQYKTYKQCLQRNWSVVFLCEFAAGTTEESQV